MVISFLIYSMDIGGTERVTHDLINEFTKRGYSVNLFCLNKQVFFLNDLLIPQENIYDIGTVNNIIDFISV